MPARICRLDTDAGLRTGASPGVDNSALLNAAFANAKPGDTFVLPTDGDLADYGEITFFDSRPDPVPEKCMLTGPNECPSAAGMCRRYAVADFREPFVTLSAESSTVQNMTLYLHQDYTSGAPIGIVQAPDQFVIHPRIRNISTTVFGTGSRDHCWAIALCLDGSASDGISSKGIREARIRDCAFWCYSYSGLYLRSVLGGHIEGITLTPMFGDPDHCDLLLDGTDIVPAYNNIICGAQLGTHAILGKEYNNLIIGDVGKVDRVDPMSAGMVIDPNTGRAVASANAVQIYHLTISPGNIAPGAYVNRPVTLPGAKMGDTLTVTSAAPDPKAALSAYLAANGAGYVRTTNIGSDVLWLSRDVAVDVQLSR